MSAMPVYGEEDDDFAYQDEHIEMESDNQEHEDLEETEFDSDPALITTAARLPIARLSPTPVPDPASEPEPILATVVAESPSLLKPARSTSHSVPPRPTTPESAAKPRSNRAAKTSEKREPKSKASATAKRGGKSKPQVALGRKGASQPAAKKQRPAKKSRARSTDKTPAKKAGAPKKAFSQRKKTIPKPLGKSKGIRGATGRKRRSA